MHVDAIMVGFRWSSLAKQAVETLVNNTIVPKALGGKLRLHVEVGFKRSIANNVMYAWPSVTSDWFLLLNDDWEFFDKNWLKYLAEHIEKPHVGIIGGMFLFPDCDTCFRKDPKICEVCPTGPKVRGTVQCADVDVYSGHVTGSGGDPEKFGYHRMAKKGCQPVLLRSDVFREIGGYDRHFVGSQYGDCDIVKQYAREGWYCYYDGRSKIRHFHKHHRATEKVKRWSQPRNLEHYVDVTAKGRYAK